MTEPFTRVSMGLTVSRKLAKILTDSRKSHHPIETLFHYPCYAILAGLISAIYLDWLSSQVSCVALVPFFFFIFPSLFTGNSIINIA